MRFLKVLPALLVFFIATGALGKTTKLETQSGYPSKAYVHKAKGDEKGIAIVALHGKTGSPTTPHQEDLYPALTREGYMVIAPTMPWSDFDGSFTQSLEVINAAVSHAAAAGKKLVIVGHSMGATVALLYASQSPPKAVLAVVAVAPGHIIHLSKKFKKVTGKSVEKAREMAASGRGNKKASFKDINKGEVFTRRMTADNYRSFFDPERFPNLKERLPSIKLPVLWIAGNSDRLTKIYDMRNLSALLPNGTYKEIPGKHKSVLGNAGKPIVDWLQKL